MAILPGGFGDCGCPPANAVAGRNRLGRGRWSQLFPPVSRSPRIDRGPSSTPGRLGKTSSWRLPLRGWDAEECRQGCCFSPAHRGESNRQRSSVRAGQTVVRCVRGSGRADRPVFREPHDRHGVHRRRSWLAQDWSSLVGKRPTVMPEEVLPQEAPGAMFVFSRPGL